MAYDHIVLDTPPVCMFTDAVLLGSHADAAVLVVRCGSDDGILLPPSLATCCSAPT